MGLSAAGMASGLDIAGMTQQLVAAERKPKADRITTQQKQVNVSLSAYGQVKSSVSAMQSMLEKFGKDEAFNGQKATSDNSDYLSIKATAKAKSGVYNINIQQMAQSHKLMGKELFSADPEASLGSGEMVIKVGDKSMTLNIGEDNDDLSSVVDAINNADDNPGVTATLINTGKEGGSQIVFSTTETGENNTIEIDTSAMTGQLASLAYKEGMADSKVEQMQAAQDAKIMIDNFTTVTSSNNTFEDVIEGVTLDLKKLTGTSGSENPETDDIDVKSVKITIESDEESTKDSLKSFVDSYNSLMGTIDKLTGFDADKDPDDPNRAGALNGDSLTRSVTTQMRNLLNEPIEINGKLYQMSDFGISIQRDGTLELEEDSDKLDDIISENFAVIGQFFAQEDSGFLAKADKLLDSFTDKTDGSLSVKEETLKERQKSLDDDMTELNKRMVAYEDRTYKQFLAMDEAIGQMNNQLSSMMSLMMSFD
ncbi:flagellar hook protein [Photobacterium phosphoreum]|uniref:Flagellar hook-associated protein 2 n=1 Tax=Photobacterium phosphoreum TaxID=659 RepID=A0A2T3JXG5_PHOPO|nr:flagellar filament capping protein FliD [Photobacterium phosphoreum]PSU27643.1 flagellar hook protein [Photobacterium phosphoreum]PSU41593.1 flagellar hook protein [Photobacterium phosphoreum]PSU54082.1 flagellar hook protein [Photobacterium phosphoreum]